MPDSQRLSISATEASALFDASPYVSRWMLFRRFRYGEEIAQDTNSRMDWGLVLEPVILGRAAKDLNFIVTPNRDSSGNQAYVRNGRIGCTRDADVYAPDRGHGVCEAKCIFDYATWMREWGGGNKVPRHIEIQCQTQMKVGDGKTPFSWGVFALFVCGDTQYIERKPIKKFWDALDAEVARFFDDVENDREPDPLGMPNEVPLLNEVFPVDEEKVLDMRDHQDGIATAELVRMLEYHRAQRLGHEKGEEALKLKLRGIAKDHGVLLLPHGITARFKQNKTSVGVKTYVPKNVREGELEDA